jgi:hypothetical protein
MLFLAIIVVGLLGLLLWNYPAICAHLCQLGWRWVLRQFQQKTVYKPTNERLLKSSVKKEVYLGIFI